MKRYRWFISHPTGGHQSAPAFFRALRDFVEEYPKIELVLPYDETGKLKLTKELIEQADLVVAEISLASTGSGIELGWAHADGKPIIAFHQSTTPMSPAVQFVATAIHAYVTEAHVIKVLKTLLSSG